jgi:hypothetical protein
MFSLMPLTCGLRPRIAHSLTLAGCYATLALVLTIHAAEQVRESLFYRALFLAAAARAIEVLSRGLAVFGLNPVVDGLERDNRAVRFATIGLWVERTAGAIGANLGEGDEIDTTLIPMALCTIGLLSLGFAASQGCQQRC